jgi:hypothetical protein
MTVYDLTVAAGEDRDLEAKIADATAHAIHDRVVLAWVARVENELVNWPVFDALRHRVLLEVLGDFSWHLSPFPFTASTFFKPGLFRVVRLRVSTKRVLTPRSAHSV